VRSASFPVPPRRSSQNLTLALVALAAGVVALAGLLWWVPKENPQQEFVKAEASSPREASAIDPPAVLHTVPNSGTVPNSVTDSKPTLRPAAISKHRISSPSEKGNEEDQASDSSGELVVYERGKVVYRAGPVTRPVTSAAETEKLGETLDAVPASDNTAPSSTAAGFTGGKLIYHVAPVYSEEARALRVQGVVVLEGIIGKDGAVREIRIVDGDARLTDAAIEAVRQWRYEPFRSNGEPVDMLSTMTVHFH